MDSIAIETTVRIPWGAQLTRTLSAYPAHSESDGAQQAPELPLVRVQAGGAVAILNYFGRGFAPAGTLRWSLQAPGDASPHLWSAPDPFAPGRAVLAVDFWVDEQGRLIVLEKVAAEGGGEASRLAVVPATGAPVVREPLEGNVALTKYRLPVALGTEAVAPTAPLTRTRKFTPAPPSEPQTGISKEVPLCTNS